MELLKQRYIHAWFVQLSGLVALMVGKLNGESYVALSTLALAAYAASAVADRKNDIAGAG